MTQIRWTFSPVSSELPLTLIISFRRHWRRRRVILESSAGKTHGRVCRQHIYPLIREGCNFPTIHSVPPLLPSIEQLFEPKTSAHSHGMRSQKPWLMLCTSPSSIQDNDHRSAPRQEQTRYEALIPPNSASHKMHIVVSSTFCLFSS